MSRPKDHDGRASDLSASWRGHAARAGRHRRGRHRPSEARALHPPMASQGIPQSIADGLGAAGIPLVDDEATSTRSSSMVIVSLCMMPPPALVRDSYVGARIDSPDGTLISKWILSRILRSSRLGRSEMSPTYMLAVELQAVKLIKGHASRGCFWFGCERYQSRQ